MNTKMFELDMTIEEQKKRPSVARKNKPAPKVTISIRINPELIKRITGNRSAFIESAIVEHLNR